MFTKILVPLDGSTLSEKALPYAIGLAQTTGAGIVLARVADKSEIHSVHDVEKLLQEIEDYLHRVRNYIANTSTHFQLPASRMECYAIHGHATQEVCNLARSTGADVVVMTTHGRSGLSRLATGSISGQIIHSIGMPVVLVRPQVSDSNSELLQETLLSLGEPCETWMESLHRPTSSILVPMDGSDGAATALAPAMQLAARTGATIHLISAVSAVDLVGYGYLLGTPYGARGVEDLEEENRKHAQNYLESISRQIVAAGLAAPIKVIKSGDADQVVLDYARSTRPLAIVIATHSRGLIGQFLLGSIAEKVMRESHLPVMMVAYTAPILTEDVLIGTTTTGA